MGTIAEQVYEAVKALPEQQAAEVLDFAEFLQAKMGQQSAARREQALAVLDSYVGLYDGKPINQDEQAKLQELKVFFSQYQKDLAGFKFDRDEANAR